MTGGKMLVFPCETIMLQTMLYMEERDLEMPLEPVLDDYTSVNRTLLCI